MKCETRHVTASTRAVVAAGVLVLMVLAGCARSTRSLSPAVTGSTPVLSLAEETDADLADYDPWQPFNERMFWFNHRVLDRFLIRPVAVGWSKITPEPARRALSRLLLNLEMPKRLVNNLAQARPLGAGREVARFVVNTTVGIGGLLDVAAGLGIKASPADAGTTLALLGFPAGPYLVLPTLPPLTVRDAIGRPLDGALDPISYFLPFFANRAKSVITSVNNRSLELKFFAGVEESVLDLYSAARNGYLQRRRMIVRLARDDRNAQWRWAFQRAEAEPERAMAASLADEDPT
jgi:phospholipid-binding lipoprotein MlaA